MKNFLKYPEITDVKINDRFWTPYIEGIRDIMVPYCFDKFEETGYIKNFENVAENNGEKHIGEYLMCAEGADNDGCVDFTLAENPEFRISGEKLITQ